MGNRRFSVTTYVLVGISLVALYFVGKTVNPPPPAPPKEAAAAAPAAPARQPTAAELKEKQKEMAARDAEEARVRKQQMQKIAAAAKNKPVTKVGNFNPTSIDTDADYWQHYRDGAKGAEEMAAKVAAAKAKLKGTPVVPQKKPATLLPPAP